MSVVMNGPDVVLRKNAMVALKRVRPEISLNHYVFAGLPCVTL